VLALGRAVAHVLGSSRLVIARDPRVSGPVLESAFSAGAAAQRVRVEQLGVLPTPAVAMISAHENVPGVVVTAHTISFLITVLKFLLLVGASCLTPMKSALKPSYIFSSVMNPMRLQQREKLVLLYADQMLSHCTLNT
jgi:phosphoglucosamine mutase